MQHTPVLGEEGGDLFEHFPVTRLFFRERRERGILRQVEGEAADELAVSAVQLDRGRDGVSGQRGRLPESKCAIGQRLGRIERRCYQLDEAGEAVDLFLALL